MESEAQAILSSSLVEAAECADGNPEEKAFHISGHVFLGTKFGAADRLLLDTLQINTVVNLTAGATRVPNYFAGGGIEYIHIELTDELISCPGFAIPRAYRAIRSCGQEDRNVLVHCSAGLSRSVTAVLAYLMRDHGMTLREARDLVQSKRGRRPKCNPSFWCYLSALERELHKWPPGTPPSLDWTPMLIEDMRNMGINHEAQRLTMALQIKADWVDFLSFYTALSGPGIRQLVLAQVIAQKPAPDAKAACRSAAFAMEAMEVYHCWPAVVAFALRVLQPLLCHQDTRVFRTIGAAGLAGKVIQVMSMHRIVEDVQEAGCGTLAFLISVSEDFTDEVIFLGGIATVIEALRAHPAHEALQSTGCICLTALLRRPICRQAAHTLGAIGVLLASMRARPQSEQVQRFCITALQAVATESSSAASAELIHLGAAGVAMRAAKRFPALEPMAMGLLCTMGVDAPKPSAPHGADSPAWIATGQGPPELVGEWAIENRSDEDGETSGDDASELAMDAIGVAANRSEEQALVFERLTGA